MTLYLYECYQPYAFWHSGWVGPCPVQLTSGNEATSSPLGAGPPSSYDFGVRCTPSLGERDVVVNFTPTLACPAHPSAGPLTR